MSGAEAGNASLHHPLVDYCSFSSLPASASEYFTTCSTSRDRRHGAVRSVERVRIFVPYVR